MGIEVCWPLVLKRTSDIGSGLSLLLPLCLQARSRDIQREDLVGT